MVRSIKDLRDWVAGKPKTRIKVIDFGALPNTGTKLVPHGLPYDQYIKIVRTWGLAWSANHVEKYILPYVSVTTMAGNIRINLSPTEIGIATATNLSNTTGKLYIEYEV